MRNNNGCVGAWEVGDYIVCNACETHTPSCVSPDVEKVLKGRRVAIPADELEDIWGIVGLNCDACGDEIVSGSDSSEDEVGL